MDGESRAADSSVGTRLTGVCTVMAVAAANLAVRLLLELAAIGALAYWGWHVSDSLPVRVVVTIVAAGTLVVAWALVVAPKASNPIPQDVRMLIGTALLLVAAGALAITGQQRLALVLAGLVIVNQVLLLVLEGGEP
jgi:Protein of unknown function (DUF2568)